MAREVGAARDAQQLKRLDDAQPVGRAQGRGGARLVLHPGDPPRPAAGFVKAPDEVRDEFGVNLFESGVYAVARPMVDPPFAVVWISGWQPSPPGGPAPADALATLAERFDRGRDRPSPRPRARAARGPGPAVSCDAVIAGRRMRLGSVNESAEPDAVLSADSATWARIAADVRGGMEAFRAGPPADPRQPARGRRLPRGDQRRGRAGPARVRDASARAGSARSPCSPPAPAPRRSCASTASAGRRRRSCPRSTRLADDYRVVAIDLPGFGESDKPIGAPYDAPWFARSAFAAMDALGIERAHIAGNSMGGRVAIEAGLTDRDRIGALLLLSPALAWLRSRPWAPLLRALRPELGLIQPAPRPVVEAIVRQLVPSTNGGWTARRHRRVPARLSHPQRARGLLRGGAQHLPGRAARRRRLLDAARDAPVRLAVRLGQEGHARPDRLHEARGAGAAERQARGAQCGHVPQVERPRETHAAIRKFLAEL